MIDSEVLRSVKVRGRPLERTLEPRRKRIHSARRSSSRRSKHHDHFYQRLYGGQMKPFRAASMLAMMMFSPFFIIFMQVPLPSLLVPKNFASLSLSVYALVIVAGFKTRKIVGYETNCSAQFHCLHSLMLDFKKFVKVSHD